MSDAIEAAKARLTESRLGKSWARETDKDLIALRDLIAYAERADEWEYGRRDRETGVVHALRGHPLDDWWSEAQDRHTHVRRKVSPWEPMPKEGTADE